MLILVVVAVVFIVSSGTDDTAVQEGVAYLESLENREPMLQATQPSSEPVKNHDASESTEPSDSSESSEPTETLESTEPTETLESTEPTETVEPTEATEPSEPSGLSAEQLALIEQIRNEEVDIWSMFHDYVILGDSRAVGFWYFDFLPKENCLTGGGDTIRNVEMNMDGILALNPKYIFLCYGLNDVSIGYWKTSDVYVEEMMEVIADLQERLPEATVIVSSILPARDPAFELSSKWYNIPEYSAAVEAACKEAGVIFVNNDEICDLYAKWWQPDGIHVRPEFYPYWAQNLIVGIIEGGKYE